MYLPTPLPFDPIRRHQKHPEPIPSLILFSLVCVPSALSSGAIPIDVLTALRELIQGGLIALSPSSSLLQLYSLTTTNHPYLYTRAYLSKFYCLTWSSDQCKGYHDFYKDCILNPLDAQEAVLTLIDEVDPTA